MKEVMHHTVGSERSPQNKEKLKLSNFSVSYKNLKEKCMKIENIITTFWGYQKI